MESDPNLRMDNPLVSIVVPAYNEEKEIQNALSEMKKQTYPNTEVIVVDDGSTDKTFEVAKKSGNSIKNFLIVKIDHAGPSASRNAGVKHSNGDIVSTKIKISTPINAMTELKSITGPGNL